MRKLIVSIIMVCSLGTVEAQQCAIGKGAFICKTCYEGDKVVNNSFMWYKFNKTFLDKLIKKANEGHLTSMYVLGFYYNQIAKNKNLNESIKWFSRGTNLGDLSCCYMLADTYLQKAIKLNDLDLFKKSLKYYEVAAKQGHKIAQMTVGFLCYNLKEKISDDWKEKCIMYLTLAVEQKITKKENYNMNKQQEEQLANLRVQATKILDELDK